MDIHNNNLNFPLIVFDNSDVISYKRSVNCNSTIIHVLSMADYQSMMEILVLSYDIFYYLQERSHWITDSGGLPHIVVGEYALYELLFINPSIELIGYKGENVMTVWISNYILKPLMSKS